MLLNAITNNNNNIILRDIVTKYMFTVCQGTGLSTLHGLFNLYFTISYEDHYPCSIEVEAEAQRG